MSRSRARRRPTLFDPKATGQDVLPIGEARACLSSKPHCPCPPGRGSRGEQRRGLVLPTGRKTGLHPVSRRICGPGFTVE